MDFTRILYQYFGYSAFRPLQEDIVRSAYQGRDTLALLPTGGGKSICFQVPALAKEGICLVVTPLIALMKDQVESLQAKGIKAVAIYSGLSNREIDMLYNSCAYGEVKFLYLSPERLGTDLFKQRVQHLKVNLIAIDEAHCISQWGYDFRPSYLHIAQLREWLPEVPVLALTATATPEVAVDIMQRLQFKQPHLLQNSFERKNLVYVVRHTEDKYRELLKIVHAVAGSAIVYVRTRGETQKVASLLLDNGISADTYHAGLQNEQRSAKQDSWKQGHTRIMVATNAFGMGIDKADVRLVVHMALPDSLEAYYQEAGRAGRDGHRAYAVLLYQPSDKLSMQKRAAIAFPGIATIKQVYQAIGSYLNIAYGSGCEMSYDFKIEDFAYRYHLHVLTVYSALQFLQRDGYLEYSEDVNLPARIMFVIERNDLYKIQVANPDLDKVVKALLRAYSGIFSQYVALDEGLIARATRLTPQQVYEALKKLGRLQVVSYMPRKRTPLLYWNQERYDDKNLRISPENYQQRLERYTLRTRSMLEYATSTTKCRSQQLLAYFGELDSYRCGLCDVCQERNELDLSKYEFDLLLEDIKKILATEAMTITMLMAQLKHYKEDKVLKVVSWLQDNGKLQLDDFGRISWHNR